MSKGMKALMLSLVGLIIWIAFIYGMFAFVKGVANPFEWTEEARIFLCGIICIYIGFIPAISYSIKHDL
jgi:uncharacterized membrane protein YhdT